MFSLLNSWINIVFWGTELELTLIGYGSVPCSQLKYFGEVSVRVRCDQPHTSKMMILQLIYSIHNSWHGVRTEITLILDLIAASYNQSKSSYNKADSKDLNLRYNSWLRKNEKMTKRTPKNSRISTKYKISPINLLLSLMHY